MNSRALLAAAAFGALATVSGVDARMANDGPSAMQLLARQWNHVGTTDTATGADLSASLPRLSSRIAYMPDGTYLSGESDRGVWTLSADGRTLTLVSATFEYSVELSVERLDEKGLRVVSRQVPAIGAEPVMVVESFAPAKRQVVTAR